MRMYDYETAVKNIFEHDNGRHALEIINHSLFDRITNLESKLCIYEVELEEIKKILYSDANDSEIVANLKDNLELFESVFLNKSKK